MSKRGILIENGDLVLPDRVLNRGAVYIEDGKIVSVGSGKDQKSRLPPDAVGVDAADHWVCPALIEMHIHGCGGYSFHDPREGHLAEIARFLSARGVGLFLPTMVPDETYMQAVVKEMETLRAPERMAGLYLEGPFISKEKKGGILESYIRPFSPEFLNHLLDIAQGHLRIMTLAPELSGSADLIKTLRSRDIIPAFGHSSAVLSDLEIPAENLLVTHLYNAMLGVSHKNPGLAHWALLNDEVYTELNGDGTHVHPAAIDLTLRLRPAEKIILISDAVVAAGLEGEGPYYHGNKATVLKGGGVYYEDDGTLVGSRLLVKDVIWRMVKHHAIPVYQAVAMATRNPANLLGLENKGALEVGKDADVSLFNKNFSKCRLQLFQGQVMHSDFDVLPI